MDRLMISSHKRRQEHPLKDMTQHQQQLASYLVWQRAVGSQPCPSTNFVEDPLAQQAHKGKVGRLGPEEVHGHASKLYRPPLCVQGALQLQVLQRELEQVLHLLLQVGVFCSVEGPLQQPQEVILQL